MDYAVSLFYLLLSLVPLKKKMQNSARDKLHETDPAGKKRSRIEHRAAREVLGLKTVSESQVKEEVKIDAEMKNVHVLCTAEKINIRKLYKFLKERGMQEGVTIHFGECLHMTVPMEREGAGPELPQKMQREDMDEDSEIESNSLKKVEFGVKSLHKKEEIGEAFFFDYGVVVFWGLDEKTELHLLDQQRFFEEKKYPLELIEKEQFRYAIVKEGASIVNDVIYLDSDHYFNKMIISNAIAQSTKLDFFEQHVERTIESVIDLPDEIVNGGYTRAKREDVLKMIGVLHKLKFNLNLVTSILDTPEILWHHPAYSELYESFKTYLELKNRAELLNQRCDIIQEILNLLSTHIATKNSEKLEKTIIYLICFESLIACVHLFLTWKSGKG